jgi:hypothetical protein
MKKVLLSLLLFFIVLPITRINAYCVYNFSPNKNDIITVFTYKNRGLVGVLFTGEARHEVVPEADSRNPQAQQCWNWKEIDSKNRNKEWFFRAYKGRKKEGKTQFDVIATGNFPIGGSIVFYGYDYGKPKFKIYLDGKISQKYTNTIKTFRA